ncbi:SDR family NAD(P)-dependent oxidoreductase [Actinokineospora enzanensis]|uniref:SDR family NAD(P)-dependent oxidoreductase n=1 Tax=Actinokineospora enzanensis TaxID=155975 RepID=UPI00035DAD1B|nr:SDR family oxidoreductase [Actinokineospora enzanensis]
MELNLIGRVAVVTGASKGIGLAVTHTLLAEGARVVAVSRTAGDLAGLAGDLRHVALDLMDPAAPERAIEAAVDAFGGVDVVVNNAGGPPPGIRLPRGSFLDAADADWQAMVEFNLFSVVRLVRAAIPHLLARGGGSIVNVATTLARQPAPMSADYGAVKAAVLNLSKVLSEEFGGQGIRVNTVSPGAVRTPWWTDAGGAADRIADMAGSDRDTVLTTLAPRMMNMVTGRLVEPREVADVVAFLASPLSASTTGAEFVVDGGFLKSL